MLPSQGTSPRGPEFDASGLDAQTRDVELATGEAWQWSNVNTTRVAAAGFSFGGGAALLAAARDPRVRAAVSIDGIGLWQTTIPRLRAAVGYVPGRVRSAVMARNTAGDVFEDLSVFHEQPLADRTLLRLTCAGHHTFIASPVIASVVQPLTPPCAATKYATAAGAFRAFLDATLRSDSAARRRTIESPTADAPSGRIASIVHDAALAAPAAVRFSGRWRCRVVRVRPWSSSAPCRG